MAGQAAKNSPNSVMVEEEAILKKRIVLAGDNDRHCSVLCEDNPLLCAGTVKGRSGTEMSFLKFFCKSLAYASCSKIHENIRACWGRNA